MFDLSALILFGFGGILQCFWTTQKVEFFSPMGHFLLCSELNAARDSKLELRPVIALIFSMNSDLGLLENMSSDR